MAKKTDDAGGMGHNSGNDTYNVTADELRQFVERFEQLESEKKDVADQQKELMAEAKGRGFDTKALRAIVAERKKNADDLAEFEAVLDLYRLALGMVPAAQGGFKDDDDEAADDSDGMV